MVKNIFKAVLNHLPLISILFFALILRLSWLNKFPVSLTYDEVKYVPDAKAIFYTGKDISGSWSPFSLTTKPIGVLTAELPALLVSPFIGPARLSLFTARFPYAFFSVILVLILYLISQELLNSKRIALIAALLLSVNPWSFHFGRTAFEAPVAILFYLIALYIFLKMREWKILLSFFFLFLAFFSYLGTKLIFLPFVMVLCLFHYSSVNRRTSKKPYILFFLLSLLLVSNYALSLRYQPANKRMSDLLFFTTDKAAEVVNMERRLSLPTFLTIFFSNKAMYFLRTFIANYISAFSPKLLFLFGEERGAFSLWTHGLFYYIDLIFIVIGMCILFERNKRVWLLLLSLMAIAPLPSALGSDYQSYVLRSALLYPLLIILIAGGISYIIEISSQYKRFVSLGLLTIYIVLLANYLYLYFFRYSIYGSEGFFLSGRILSKYLSLYSQLPEKEIVVFSLDASGLFKQYLFYTGLYTKKNAKEIAKKIRQQKLNLGMLSLLMLVPIRVYCKIGTLF